jgi:PPM family protein phosphatase
VHQVQLTAEGCSDPGPRPENQDTYFIDPDLGLFVVADGMGGHNAGDVASRVAVDAVVEFIRSTSDARDITWPFPLDPARSMAANRTMVAMRMANQRVQAHASRNTRCSGMATTLVMLLIEDGRVVIGHAGDSRAYRLRDGSIRQMTHDHTWLNAMVAAGVADGAIDHPMRHVLTNGIGMRAEFQPSIGEDALTRGERWLICSDGVHNHLTPADLEIALAGGTTGAADRVVRLALVAATTDNATAVVVCVQ